jgi:competence protein ComEC
MEHERTKKLDTIFFSLVLGFCSGIIFDSLFTPTTPMLICIGVFAFVSLGVYFFSKTSRLILLGISIALVAALFGSYRAEIAKPDMERFSNAVGTKVSVEGLVAGKPSVKNGSQKFTLDVSPLRRGHGGNVSINVTAKDIPPVAYGDKVLVSGTLALPENFMTGQGIEFDYVSYLYKDDILYQLKNSTLAVESHGHGNWLVGKLIPVKDAIVTSFHRVLPGREADLLAGLNLGEKSNIDSAFRDDLVTTGTIHMIALSGYNVTVVANALRDLFVDILGLSARVASFAGGICIILFVVMTGLQSSAIRAGIMALIGLFARGKGRAYDAFRALILAGFIMILYDPKYLVYDVSFQLSFLATLGIIFVTPALEQKFARIPKKFLFIIPLREAMSVTLGAQLGVLPFILFKMGTLSIISLPANIMALPAVPFAMGIGMLAGLVGWFSPGIAYPFSIVTYGLLRYITGTIQFFAKVPYAAVVLKHFPLWLCLALYALLIWWLYNVWKKEKAELSVTSQIAPQLLPS